MSDIAELVVWLRSVLDHVEQVATDAEAADGSKWEVAPNPYQHDVNSVNGKSASWTVVYDEGRPTMAEAQHIALHDPAAVLADVAAKRAIVDAYEATVQHERANAKEVADLIRRRSEDGVLRSHGWELYGQVRGLTYAVQVVAAAYAHHDGYREEWRP